MLNLDQWQSQITYWYQNRNDDQVEELIPLIMHPPVTLWGPEASPKQGKALACWLDGCMRVYQYYITQGQEMTAYQYLNFAYAKMQALASDAMADRELKLWAMERLEHLIVVLLEHCSRCHWLSECENQVEGHIHFMAAQHNIDLEDNRNDDQGASM